MFKPILFRVKTDFDSAYKSIKLPEVEEWFDIYFSRFLGYYLAVISNRLGLSPNHVSILSLVAGVFAGICFYFQDNVTLIVFACILITLSGLLDSADGQLARMTGTSSELGRKIDAIIDTFVFVACYVGGAIYFLDDYGPFIVPLTILAGYLHSVKSAAYEFYKTEFIYYIKNARDHRIPDLTEVKREKQPNGFWNKCLYYMEVDYIGKQAFYISRTKEHRVIFEKNSFGERKEEFQQLYSKFNTKILTWWALSCGTNMHRTTLMICSLFGRMDIYFLITIAMFLPMFVVNRWQGNLDKKIILVLDSNRSITSGLQP